jgi:hypothetical protein
MIRDATVVLYRGFFYVAALVDNVKIGRWRMSLDWKQSDRMASIALTVPSSPSPIPPAVTASVQTWHMLANSGNRFCVVLMHDGLRVIDFETSQMLAEYNFSSNAANMPRTSLCDAMLAISPTVHAVNRGASSTSMEEFEVLVKVRGDIGQSNGWLELIQITLPEQATGHAISFKSLLTIGG